MYIWELPEWPKWTWDAQALAPLLDEVESRQIALRARIEDLSHADAARLRAMTADILGTSEIEGVYMDRAMVEGTLKRLFQSSVFPIHKRTNGTKAGNEYHADKQHNGIVSMVYEALTSDGPITSSLLFDWHARIVSVRNGFDTIRVGSYRETPVQIIGSPLGVHRIHYEGPPAARVPQDMQTFLEWVNYQSNIRMGHGAKHLSPFIAAGIAHMWFVTIHPFDDGNGRIGRAISDKLLGNKYYSVSGELSRSRRPYFSKLANAQSCTNLNITPWLAWFLETTLKAIRRADHELDRELRAEMRCKHLHQVLEISGIYLSRGDMAVMREMVRETFVGNLTPEKWRQLSGRRKVSRDHLYVIKILERSGLIERNPNTRKVSYRLTGSLEARIHNPWVAIESLQRDLVDRRWPGPAKGAPPPHAEVIKN